ncbi:zinc-dependent peptidase [Caenimonas aquaedulcis]|uniref:Zinc-dependent peptidase n=1 Tax=Caenimonas aquaedulcis TaxID=2793270 RepID=A0A931MG44_9BURK|nr:M90 family metallopeptidase [Caenimonas aquaedulcis]MBG9387499.1 zinc-dependent peptidase [Caenimonas aquaedulcis]
MFGWLRKRRARVDIPDALWNEVAGRFPFIASRPPHDLARLRELSGEFLASKEFNGAGGFVITDRVALSIAVQAVLPVLNLGLDWYDDFVGIVVHADEVVAHREHTDEDHVVHHWDEVLSGEAMDQGPVTLSWRDVEEARESADAVYNVVIHEFAHKLDMRDGRADGCPPLPSRAARRHWIETLEAQFEAFREKVAIAERFSGEPTWLDPYGATAIDEFFAVACEAYFVRRERFAQEFPPLVPLFDSFFQPARG